MPNLHVFIHVAGMGPYREVVAELMGQISGSGLLDAASSITACTVGIKGQTTLAYLLWPKVLWEHGGCLDEWEYPTLRLLHARAKEDPDSRLIYVHTKGVSRTDRKFSSRWRRLMAHHVIERWRDCLKALDTVDTCGIYHFHAGPGNAHYSGNFWAARADYVKNLEVPAPRECDAHPRMFAELWLLSNGGSTYSFDLPGLPVGMKKTFANLYPVGAEGVLQ